MKSTIDKEIEQEYYRQASGKVIDIMDICKVFSHARAAISTGCPVSQAVRAAVLMYCQDEKQFHENEREKNGR